MDELTTLIVLEIFLLLVFMIGLLLTLIVTATTPAPSNQEMIRSRVAIYVSHSCKDCKNGRLRIKGGCGGEAGSVAELAVGEELEL